MSTRKLVIGGDCLPINRCAAAFSAGDPKTLFNDLLAELQSANLVVVNLECPLTSENTPIVKSGPLLRGHPASTQGLKAAGIHAVNLANNHIMDHGLQGLESTRAACSEAEIETFGAGRNLEEASRILVREVLGLRVGLMGMAEHEFSIATENGAGANPLDVMSFVRIMKKQASNLDFLIILLHAGVEGYPFPRPRLIDTCRFLVEQGANAVICQHTHCPVAYEVYQGAPIVYGQGNLLFDWDQVNEDYWHQGFLVNLLVQDDATCRMELIPYRQCDEKVGARKMSEADTEKFLRELKERSMRLADMAFIIRQWRKFCESYHDDYHSGIHGHTRLEKALNRRVRWLRLRYSGKRRLETLNLIRCESHREVLETVLSENKPIWK